MLIWGTSTKVTLLAILRFTCIVCDREAPQRLYERVKRFTFFFVPLFPVSTSYLVDCVGCGHLTPTTKEWAKDAAAHAG